ncbi:hypothetical protein [Tenggerimyces flavus]|uniref:Uncharacterized protein n=1 Tax=Tenggerimyces flavus TaxID=1708749 RepID=A0ABV7YIJ0_9ACTN|nr:hypothetical protein [Tenggerimyces flavus]MBM7789245.1 hypothetical protein [Tenggerimyces flavus]
MPHIDPEFVATRMAKFLHDVAAVQAGETLRRRGALVCVASPDRVVLVRAVDGAVVLDLTVDPSAVDDVLVALDPVLGRASAVLAWDGPTGKDVVEDLVRLSPQRDVYRFDEVRWVSAGAVFAGWHGEPSFLSGPVPQPRAKDRPIPGYRVLSRRFEEYLEGRTVQLPQRYAPQPQPLPGGTGDPVADARLIIQALRDVVDQTAPISPRALFPHPANPLPSALMPTDANAYARRMHNLAADLVRPVLEDPSWVILVPTIDDVGLPRRFVLLKVSDGTVGLDVAADPDAETGPTSYQAVLAKLDATMAELDVVRVAPVSQGFRVAAATAALWKPRTVWLAARRLLSREGGELRRELRQSVATGGLGLRTTSAGIAVWGPRSTRNAVLRLVHRDGELPTRREARGHRWMHADWHAADYAYQAWYADPPEQPPGSLDPVRTAATIAKDFSTNPQPLPGATGDAVEDARRILALLREIGAGTAPVSPRFPADEGKPEGMEDNRPRE